MGGAPCSGGSLASGIDHSVRSLSESSISGCIEGSCGLSALGCKDDPSILPALGGPSSICKPTKEVNQ